MINKIVKLRNGRSYRILDSIIYQDNTFYIVIDVENSLITQVYPKDIVEIMFMDHLTGDLHSMSDSVIKNGL
jgi:hypothetical protein